MRARNDNTGLTRYPPAKWGLCDCRGLPMSEILRVDPLGVDLFCGECRSRPEIRDADMSHVGTGPACGNT